MHEFRSLVKSGRGILSKRTSEEQSHSPISIDWKIESSPAVVGGDEESVSSILSGRVSVQVNEDHIDAEDFSGGLYIRIIQKKPFKSRCEGCKDQHQEVQNWSFLNQATTLQKGSHQFPFSAIIPDHLPATMDTPLLGVSYEFRCEVQFRSKKNSNKETETRRFNRHVTVRRTVPLPEGPVYSTRSFASAGIEIRSSIDSIVHIEEDSKASLSLKGLSQLLKTDQDTEVWRIFKGSWKLEEKMKTTVMPCDRHKNTSADGGEGRVHRKTRVLREKNLYKGWTVADANGDSHLEFAFGINKSSSGSHPDYSYDTKSRDGTEVFHLLTVELVLVKETFPQGRPDLAVRTGAGRILRLHYRVAIVDYSIAGPGCIIENLPSYHEIWPSPPTYSEEEINSGQENTMELETP